MGPPLGSRGKLGDLRDDAVTQCALQWGYGLEAVERRSRRASSRPNTAGFNGATAWKPWKEFTPFSHIPPEMGDLFRALRPYRVIQFPGGGFFFGVGLASATLTIRWKNARDHRVRSLT